MGSTNFLPFNPSEVNQESDSTYLSDSLRTGGVTLDATLPSPLLNKVWFQSSNFAAAFAQMLANKNYTVNDSPFSSLVSVLSNILTNADIKPNLTSVAFSPTPTFNAAISNGFDIVLTGNVTSSTLINTNIAQILTFVIKQGSSTFTFVPPANINGWQPINTAPNSVTTQTFIVREDGTIWPYITLGLGYAASFGTSGYIELPALLGGFTIQWGIYNGLPDTSAVSVVLPKVFANQMFGAIAIDMNHVGGNNRVMGTTNFSNTSFSLSAQGSGANAFWIAFGN